MSAAEFESRAEKVLLPSRDELSPHSEEAEPPYGYKDSCAPPLPFLLHNARFFIEPPSMAGLRLLFRSNRWKPTWKTGKEMAFHFFSSRANRIRYSGAPLAETIYSVDLLKRERSVEPSARCSSSHLPLDLCDCAGIARPPSRHAHAAAMVEKEDEDIFSPPKKKRVAADGSVDTRGAAEMDLSEIEPISPLAIGAKGACTRKCPLNERSAAFEVLDVYCCNLRAHFSDDKLEEIMTDARAIMEATISECVENIISEWHPYLMEHSREVGEVLGGEQSGAPIPTTDSASVSSWSESEDLETNAYGDWEALSNIMEPLQAFLLENFEGRLESRFTVDTMLKFHFLLDRIGSSLTTYGNRLQEAIRIPNMSLISWVRAKVRKAIEAEENEREDQENEGGEMSENGLEVRLKRQRDREERVRRESSQAVKVLDILGVYHNYLVPDDLKFNTLVVENLARWDKWSGDDVELVMQQLLRFGLVEPPADLAAQQPVASPLDVVNIH